MVGMIMILMVTNSFFRQEDGRGAGAMMAPALCRIHGSWFMVHGSWFMVHGSRFMVHTRKAACSSAGRMIVVREKRRMGPCL